MADFAMQNAALHFGDDLGYVHPSMQEVIEASLINYCYFYAFMYHRKRLKAFHDNRRVIGEVIGEVVSRYVPEEKMTGERFCDLSLLHGSLCLSFAGPDTYYVTSPEDFGDVFGFGQH